MRASGFDLALKEQHMSPLKVLTHVKAAAGAPDIVLTA